jgi:NADH:ubiquinone oxidoreductase subunit K
MSDSAFKLQLLVRAEIALAKIYARRSMLRAAFVAVALVFVLMALGMLNFAAYLGLLDKYTPGIAALLVASADVACAVVVFIIGRKAGPADSEENMAQEIRDMAYTEVSKDVEDVKLRIEQLADEVKKIRTGVSTAIGTIRFFVSLLSKTVNKKPDSESS